MALQMSYGADAKCTKKSKIFASKCVERYSKVKNVDDLPDRGCTQKIGQFYRYSRGIFTDHYVVCEVVM